ncbi:MAG TPA: hypothetical protein VF530_09370 [Planctomycetota bacterium]
MSPSPNAAKLLLVALGLALPLTFALGQAAAPAKVTYEYRIVEDVESAELVRLGSEGWEFAGYLGQGKKGTGSDETLWRRAR